MGDLSGRSEFAEQATPVCRSQGSTPWSNALQAPLPKGVKPLRWNAEAHPVRCATTSNAVRRTTNGGGGPPVLEGGRGHIAAGDVFQLCDQPTAGNGRFQRDPFELYRQPADGESLPVPWLLQTSRLYLIAFKP